MAIFAIGASYNNEDVSNSFIENNIAGPGWDESEAPELHQIIKSMKVGDILYIKSANVSSAIKVKAIGIVADSTIVCDSELVEIGRNIRWIPVQEFTIEKPVEKLQIRMNTLYEEFHPEVQQAILNKVFEKIQ